MTDERDFDRISRAWLDLMPSEVPDRAVAAVLQAVARTPQVRRPWRRLPWRSTNMNRVLLAGAISAAAIAAVVGGMLLTRPDGRSVGPPAASPSSSLLSPSPSAAVPQELRYSWLGQVVEAPGLPSGRDRAILRIDATTLEMPASPSALLSSDITSAGLGVVQLASQETADGCTAGDVGLYQWSLSPRGSLLRLTATSDQCESRRAAFDGQWQRSACRNADNLCLGDLEAGTYQSQFIGPRFDEGEPWTANLGALSYAVPNSWSNTWDYPDSYVLMRSDDYATVSDDPRDATKDLIEVITRPAAALQNARCETIAKPGVGRSVDELIDHVTHHPKVTAGTPKPITIGGHAGKYVDVQIAPSADAPCPDVDGDTVFLFTEIGQDMTGSGLEQYGLWKTSKARVILLDLGDGDVVLISAHAFDEPSFEALLPDAMSIINSMRFE
jgi:hypothetical protein